MTKIDGRRMRGERARAQILAHSTWIASRDGLGALSMGRVAAEASVGKGNVQSLFGNKETLQFATLEKGVELYQTRVVFPAMSQKTPLARLLAVVRGWFDFVEKRSMPGGCFLNAVSNEYRSRPGRIRDRILEHRTATRERYRKLITEAKTTGELRSDVDVEQLVFDLVSIEAVANVASLLEDTEEFRRARVTAFKRIRDAMTSPRSKRSQRGHLNL